MTRKSKPYKTSVAGVPIVLARKPGPTYAKDLKRSEYRLGHRTADQVLAREGEWAREQLEAMGAKVPALPKFTKGLHRGAWSYERVKADDRLRVQWDRESVQAYLEAVAAAGRPQVVSEVMDESEPDLFEALEPVVAETVEPQAIAPASSEPSWGVAWTTNGGRQTSGPHYALEAESIADRLRGWDYRDARVIPWDNSSTPREQSVCKDVLQVYKVLNSNGSRATTKGIDDMATKKLSAHDVTAQIQQEVTDKIVAALETGTRPWVKGWAATGGLPKSASTMKAYQGVNAFLLGLQASAMGYGSQFWMTFKTAQDAGMMVRKGEKATTIVFNKPMLVKDEKAPDGVKKIFILKTFKVFNLDQLEGEVPAKFRKGHGSLPVLVKERDEASEAALRSSGAVILEGGDGAYYSPSVDRVHMPRFDAFKTTGGFLATLAHELVHWTGHKTRLAREGIVSFDRFGSERYAKEELVAELGAAMVCAMLGIAGEHIDNHAAYIASWIKALKGDRKAIFQAASKAQAAANLVLVNAELSVVSEDEELEEQVALAA